MRTTCLWRLVVDCRGVINQRNAANLEYICNLVGIKGIQKLKGALRRIALIGSYRIWLARNSQEWSAGELITVKDYSIQQYFPLCIS